jgi:inosose dehydratase
MFQSGESTTDLRADDGGGSASIDRDDRPRALDAVAEGHAAGVAPVANLRIANAPCSYGAFEMTVDVLPMVPEADAVLDAIADAGYEGTELGPPGYLGRGRVLRDRLDRRRLALVGGFVPLHLSRPERWEMDREQLQSTLDLFEAAGAPQARPILADAGSDRRVKNPGRAAADATLGLDRTGWRRLADGVARAAEHARARGFAPTLHPHAGTYVEATWEVERLLELTDVGIVLDTGHLLLGGGDPIQALRDWRDRIDHIHLKDVRLDVLRGVVADGVDMPEAWRRGVFCELGAGDVDFGSLFNELDVDTYAGWLVVEQDWVPSTAHAATMPAAAQARNRRWLRDNFGI